MRSTANQQMAGAITLTGKRKGQSEEIENGEEVDFADIQQIMETEDIDIDEESHKTEKGGYDNHTNSPREDASNQMRLK
jgi:hypothetical protein